MDADKLIHINLLGAQLMWLTQHAALSTTSDIVSLKPTDLEPPLTTARGASMATSTTDTGFVTQGTSGWATPPTHGALTASSWSGLPVMSPRIKPTISASSEPVLPRASQLDYETTINKLQQTVAEQNVRIAQLEQKLGDHDDLVAR